MNILKQIVTLFYPNICAGCGRIIDEEDDFCDYCYGFLSRSDLGKFCIKCGNHKTSCQCSRTVFHFEGAVAPFSTEGIAKKAMYAFKFRQKENYAELFARQMALSVKQAFFEVEFDAVICVPMAKRDKLKRGYNQSELLAVKLAQILNLPYYPDALGCVKKKKPQHLTRYKERRENVKGIYFINKPLKNKTVLLVDDIKSSGATLEECTLQLLESGAYKVYCVTGCVTKKKGKKNGN